MSCDDSGEIIMYNYTNSTDCSGMYHIITESDWTGIDSCSLDSDGSSYTTLDATGCDVTYEPHINDTFTGTTDDNDDTGVDDTGDGNGSDIDPNQGNVCCIFIFIHSYLFIFIYILLHLNV